MTNVLYITYDGLTDPLGQSQVLPYLIGLSKKGYSFHLLSCEKKKNFSEQQEKIKKLLHENNIHWHPLTYTKNPPVVSTLWDLWKMKRKAFLLQKKGKFQIVHCRSYIASLIGLQMKKKFKLKFIFDMRGFWVDERVEGGLWNLKNPLFKIIYKYFKKKEIEFLTLADYTISLTEAGKKELHQWKNIPNQPIPIEVIPCCVDTELFSPEKIDKEKLQLSRASLKISENDFILSYLGALGTWYLLDEMLIFFKQLLAKKTDAKFLFITHEDRKTILTAAEKLNIPTDKIIVCKANRQEVPIFLSLSSASVFFIKPVFSKKASSPTKQGEVMCMGVPVICNSGIGDTDEIIKDTQAGIIIQDFNETDYAGAIEKIDILLNTDKKLISSKAEKIFSLENGVEKYANIYGKLKELYKN